MARQSEQCCSDRGRSCGTPGPPRPREAQLTSGWEPVEEMTGHRMRGTWRLWRVGQAECCWDTEDDRGARGGEAGQSMEERAHSQGPGQQEHTCVPGRQSWQEWKPDQSSKKMEPKWEVAGLIQGKEEVSRARE